MLTATAATDLVLSINKLNNTRSQLTTTMRSTSPNGFHRLRWEVVTFSAFSFPAINRSAETEVRQPNKPPILESAQVMGYDELKEAEMNVLKQRQRKMLKPGGNVVGNARVLRQWQTRQRQSPRRRGWAKYKSQQYMQMRKSVEHL